ncbi:type II toxin-antitoxin system YafO family toxin [Thaumasiovibrio subtropicus]|uniref:type II toxin-antitoxin system YafO family toxin n=1 Tax=Thaumasiovibrio subtropicus TaxID=1891207 RepID=UPI000B35474D|nr:type II toxin-antitoxin system YafO family toxin [Thaumasiovibrio subtropicus]
MAEIYLKETVSEDDGHKLVFNVNPSLIVEAEQQDAFNDLYSDFIEYKTESADLGNIPCPDEDVQKDHCSFVDIFGKDKPNEFPKPDAGIENLHHVHIFDGETEFEYDKWINKAQIRRVCDTLLFYSYFQFKDVHYFYVLNFVLDPQGHEFQKDEEAMRIIIGRAEQYRLSIVGE